MVDWSNIEKKNHLILAVPHSKLFLKKPFQGFSKDDFMKKIKYNYGFISRGKTSSRDSHINDGIFAESDSNYKQIIPYVILLNPESRKIYAYQRASKSIDSHEARLHGNWSWGVGGHVDFQSSIFKIGVQEFLKEGMHRELSEEITLNNGEISKIELLGYINDDSDSVGQVHFGIVFLALTNSTSISPNDSESVEGNFLSLVELEELSQQSNVDNWSRIVLEPIKDFLNP